MLLMGCCVGRLCGLAAVALAKGLGGLSVAALLSSEEWAWVDPGVFATVGAGAFLGGAPFYPLFHPYLTQTLYSPLPADIHIIATDGYPQVARGWRSPYPSSSSK